MSFEIMGIQTHAEAEYCDVATGAERRDLGLIQWAVITLKVSKDFDFKANGAAVLKKLQAAADLIGRGD